MPGITDGEDQLKNLGRLLAELSNVKALEVLPYHTMGVEKYKALGLSYPLADVKAANAADTARARAVILAAFREKRKALGADRASSKTE